MWYLLYTLQILKNNFDGSENGSLLQSMNHTHTAFGSRLLRHWVRYGLLCAYVHTDYMQVLHALMCMCFLCICLSSFVRLASCRSVILYVIGTWYLLVLMQFLRLQIQWGQVELHIMLLSLRKKLPVVQWYNVKLIICFLRLWQLWEGHLMFNVG